MDCRLDTYALFIEALFFKRPAKFIFGASGSKMSVVGAAVIQCCNYSIYLPFTFAVNSWMQEHVPSYINPPPLGGIHAT